MQIISKFVFLTNLTFEIENTKLFQDEFGYVLNVLLCIAVLYLAQHKYNKEIINVN